MRRNERGLAGVPHHLVADSTTHHLGEKLENQPKEIGWAAATDPELTLKGLKSLPGGGRIQCVFFVSEVTNSRGC
jgi:hypothetical protein